MIKPPKMRSTEVEIEGILSDQADEAPSSNSVLIVWWSVATGVGVGTGWWIAHVVGIPFLFGVALGLSQGLVFARNWKRALIWAATTSLGAGIVATPFSFSSFAREGWVAADISVIGGLVLALSCLGVPIVVWMQCIALSKWVPSDDWIRWFGASVFSFPIIALFGKLFTDFWVPSNWVPGLMKIQAFEPRLWVIGAMWGLCTGWALAKMPQIVEPSDLIQKV